MVVNVVLRMFCPIVLFEHNNSCISIFRLKSSVFHMEGFSLEVFFLLVFS